MAETWTTSSVRFWRRRVRRRIRRAPRRGAGRTAAAASPGARRRSRSADLLRFFAGEGRCPLCIPCNGRVVGGLSSDEGEHSPPVDDGGTVRLRGKGGPGRGGAPAGDLLLTVRFAAHPQLRRQGRDLYLDVPLTISEAIAGARVEVPVPTGGSVKVRVPAGTTTGRKLRLKGKGISGKDGVGDLYLVLRPTPPETDDPAALEAAAALDAFYGSPVRDGLCT